MKKISVGCCCYNEEGNILETYDRISQVMNKLPEYDYEIVFSDNNSQDKTRDILKKICKKDKHVKAILNKVNCGVYNSGINCMISMSGDAIIMIAADLQEPPELIEEFIQYWEEGYDVVFGQKTYSKENRIKFFLRSVYYKIIDFFSEYEQFAHVTGFGLYDRSVMQSFLISARQDPQMAPRHYVAEYGFKTRLIQYTQEKRKWGKSSYNLSTYFAFAITSLCNTSLRPLRIVTVIGLLTALCSAIIGIVYFIYKILNWNSFDVGIAPAVIGMFFLGAVQLLCIGILGEYINIVLRKVSEKTLVIEEERINFDIDS